MLDVCSKKISNVLNLGQEIFPQLVEVTVEVVLFIGVIVVNFQLTISFETVLALPLSAWYLIKHTLLDLSSELCLDLKPFLFQVSPDCNLCSYPATNEICKILFHPVKEWPSLTLLSTIETSQHEQIELCTASVGRVNQSFHTSLTTNCMIFYLDDK